MLRLCFGYLSVICGLCFDYPLVVSLLYFGYPLVVLCLFLVFILKRYFAYFLPFFVRFGLSLGYVSVILGYVGLCGVIL